MIPKDALQMVEPLIHLSGIKNDYELKLFGKIVHDLLNDFEECTQEDSSGNSFGIDKGKWFIDHDSRQ